jgi:uncharacterized membrane protein YhaH (DUF805 family)
MTLAQTLFSFDGKIKRGKYAMFMVPILFINLFLNAIISEMERASAGISQDAAIMLLLWFIFVVYVGAALAIKRFHDLKMSGWNYIWLWIPLINLYFLFILLFKKSADAKNDKE